MEDLPFTPPVAQLLTLGRPELDGPEQNSVYPGIHDDDVPQLIRLVRDPLLNGESVEEPQFYAPIHAWRALRQLRAASAVDALLEALDQRQRWEDEWSMEELPALFEAIGAPAVPALATFLLDDSRNEWARSLAAETLGKIGKTNADLRLPCVEAITALLEHAHANPVQVNTGAVYALLELHAVESAPQIRRAFLSDRVSKEMVGDWGDVRREFKLDRQEGDPPERAPGESLHDGTKLGLLTELIERLARTAPPEVSLGVQMPRPDRDRLRAKRKQERRARRKNRRRR